MLLPAVDASPLLEQIAAYGPQRIHVMEDAAFSRHHNEVMGKALTHALEMLSPDIFLLPSTEGVKDILGAVSVTSGMNAIPDVAELSIDGDEVEASRPVMAAKFMARVKASMPVIASVRAGSFTAEEVPMPTEPEINRVDFVLDESELRVKVREIAQAVSGTVDLADARVVVAAGRGIRDEEGRKLIEELAALFDAAIGSSRAVVENGLFEATTQIGQTGKVVSPDLYFAIGISGAIQHAAGMQNSRVIVAINRDADAPIFKYATYGIVGDLFKVLPPLIEQIRVRKA